MPFTFWWAMAQVALGLVAAAGGAVMWRRTGHSGWAPVLILCGLGPIWGVGFAAALSPLLNAHLNAPMCGANGCAAPPWIVWHLIHLGNLGGGLIQWGGVAYGLVLLFRALRRADHGAYLGRDAG